MKLYKDSASIVKVFFRIQEDDCSYVKVVLLTDFDTEYERLGISFKLGNHNDISQLNNLMRVSQTAGTNPKDMEGHKVSVYFTYYHGEPHPLAIGYSDTPVFFIINGDDQLLFEANAEKKCYEKIDKLHTK